MQEKKIKVLFLPAWYPNKGDSMAGLFVKQHALAVKPYADVAVLHVIFSLDKQKKKIEYKYTVNEGIPTLIAYIRIRNSFFDKIMYPVRYLKAAFVGYKHLKREFGTPDIHHVHILTRSGIIAYFKNLTKGTPYIITEHWSRYLPQNSKSYRGVVKKIVTKKVAYRASIITTVSKHLGIAMQKHKLKNNYMQVSNVVDTDFFKPFPTKLVNMRPVLLHVSCFDEKPKNVKGILNAAYKLEKEGFDFELRLVGDGIDHKSCIEHAKKLQLKNVTFLGLKTEEELLKEYQTADAFVLFSRFENQPVVILEALACGLPVIATKVGGIPEILQDDFGELIDSENEDELVAAIKKVIQHPKDYNTEKMRQYAVENYSYEAVGKQFYDIYNRILEQ